MGNDFELAANAAIPPTAVETVTAVVGLAAWTGVYVGARLVGGTLALAVWGAKSGLAIWRARR